MFFLLSILVKCPTKCSVSYVSTLLLDDNAKKKCPVVNLCV